MKQSLLFVTIILLTSCQPCAKSVKQCSERALPDSMAILYDRQTSLIMWDEGRTYRTFIIRRGAPLLKMKIENIETIAFLDSCLNNLTMDTLWTFRRASVGTEFLLLRFRPNIIDTVSIGAWPGHIDLRDTVYRDTLVYRAVMEELARRDSIWLNDSKNGAIHYQSQYLGRTKAEIEFYKRHPI